MKVELKGNKLHLGDKEIELTNEQLEKLGIKENPFELIERETYYYIDETGEVFCKHYRTDDIYHDCLLESGKACKDGKLMEQKALHQNLNDLLWKFTIENGWSEEVWAEDDVKKWSIILREDFSTHWVYRYKSQGTIYFVTEEIAQKAIVEIVKPYLEEHPEFVW